MNTNDNFTPAPYGFLTTGDVLVDDLMRCLNQSGRSNAENFRAILRLCAWISMMEAEGETTEINTARGYLRNAAMMLEAALKPEQPPVLASDEDMA